MNKDYNKYYSWQLGTGVLTWLLSCQRRFQIDDVWFQSGDIRDHVAKFSEIAPNFDILGLHFFLGGGTKFLSQFYKLQSPSNMWQSLLMIGPETSEIRRRIKK